MSITDPHIRAEERGALGLLTLDRPKALNALTHGMITAMDAALRNWAADGAVKAVAIRGEGAKAFCAGGDIRAVREAVMTGSGEGARLLADEYRMNALIGAYPKPYVALIQGICMGGGAGVSVHGAYRLADPSLTFAMPETGIGFIPDVGSSYFLSRAPDRLGLYLGLTAASITLGDAMAAGLITHAVAQRDFDAILLALAEGRPVDKAIAPFTFKPEPGPLAEHRRRIATIFSASSVEGILERLDRDGSAFAVHTAQVIRGRSPTALKLVFRQIHQAELFSLQQCLAMEYRVALRMLAAPDFREGVRAALVDKDRQPKWQPASLAGVGNLEPFFASLGADELF